MSTNLRKKPRQERAKQTIEDLIEATAQLLIDTGYTTLSTNKIATRAGISIGSLYQYFSNKERIIDALIERVVEREFSVTRDQLAQASEQDQSIEEVLYTLLRALFDARLQHPKLARVLFEHVSSKGQMVLLSTWHKRIHALVVETFEQRTESYAAPDLNLAAFMIVSAVHGIMYMTTIDRPMLFEDESLIQETSAMIIGYLNNPRQT